jgi:ribosomal protein S8
MTNSFIDLVIRIKNGYMAQKDSIVVYRSKLNEEVLKKLKSLQYIKDYTESNDSKYSLMSHLTITTEFQL